MYLTIPCKFEWFDSKLHKKRYFQEYLSAVYVLFSVHVHHYKLDWTFYIFMYRNWNINVIDKAIQYNYLEQQPLLNKTYKHWDTDKALTLSLPVSFQLSQTIYKAVMLTLKLLSKIIWKGHVGHRYIMKISRSSQIYYINFLYNFL